MLDVNAIRAVKRAIVHANCPDGRASAVILKAAMPDIEVREVAYDTPEHLTMPADPGLLFCDFTPHPSRVAEFVAAGTIVLDHHRGAEAVVRAFGERGVFADEKAEPGVSGAVLAYVHVTARLWHHDPSGRTGGSLNLARLIGIRDTWQRADPDWERACAVSEAVRFLPLDEAIALGPGGVMAFASVTGELLIRKKLAAARAAAANAIRIMAGGRRAAVIPSVALTSDVADILRAEFDIVAGFDYVQSSTGARLQWSLRSCGDIDVSAIARRHGGNGHTAAAGFSVPVIDANGETLRPLNPYLMIADFLAA